MDKLTKQQAIVTSIMVMELRVFKYLFFLDVWLGDNLKIGLQTASPVKSSTPAYSLIVNGIRLRRQCSGHSGRSASIFGQRSHGYALAECP